MRSEWLRTGLVIGMHFSCFMLVLSAFHIYAEVRDHGFVPFRFYIILPVCFTVLSLVVYFSLEEKWKTISKLALYTFSICVLGVVVYGIKVVIYHATGDPIPSPLSYGLIALAAGGSLLFGAMRLMGSRWLN